MIKAKGFFLIVFALFIDGITAAMSIAIFVIAAFPGTIGGAAAGCIAGENVAGSLGCHIGGAIFGILGSIPVINGALATITVPLGAMLGFVVSISLNIILGGGLIVALIYTGMFYPKYLFFGGVEIIPGINLLPWYTTVVILCLVADSKGKKPVNDFIAESMERRRKEVPRPVQGPPTRNGVPPQERPPYNSPAPAPRREDIVLDPTHTPYKQEPAPPLPKNYKAPSTTGSARPNRENPTEASRVPPSVEGILDYGNTLGE